VKIPYNLILTAERVLGASFLGEILTLDEADSDPEKVFVEPEDVLAMYAMVLRFGDDESSLQPWIDVWPAQIESPVFWKKDDIERFLKGTGAYDSVKGAAQEELVRFNQLAKAVFTQSDFAEFGDVSFDQWRWAVALVQSRKVDFVGEDGNPFPAIVPMLDMFNHRVAGQIVDADGSIVEDTTNNATGNPNRRTAGFKASNRFAFVQANQPYTAGEQIFLHYGHFSTRELLEWFGFVLPTQNPDDEVVVPVHYLSLDPRDPSYELLGDFKRELLRSYETDSSASELVMTRAGVSAELLAAAQIINTVEADFNIDASVGKIGPKAPANAPLQQSQSQSSSSSSHQSSSGGGDSELTPESLQNVYQWFQAVCADMLQHYSTGADIQKDISLVHSEAEFASLTRAQQLFLQYSISEKEILWSVLNAFEQKERELLEKHGIDPDTARSHTQDARDEL
jgi:hypothetical protein